VAITTVRQPVRTRSSKSTFYIPFPTHGGASTSSTKCLKQSVADAKCTLTESELRRSQWAYVLRSAHLYLILLLRLSLSWLS